MQNKYTLFIISIFFLSLLIINPNRVLSETGTKNITCTGDTYVDSWYPDTNYGEKDLYMSHTNYRDRELYFAFEVTNMGDVEVTTVALILSVKQLPEYSSVSWIVLIVNQTESFSESTLTWNNRPVDKADKKSGKITEDTVYRIVFDNFTLENVNGEGDYYIHITTDTYNYYPVIFDSRDDTWNPPKLELTYQYTPTSTTTTTTNPSSEATTTTNPSSEATTTTNPSSEATTTTNPSSEATTTTTTTSGFELIPLVMGILVVIGILRRRK